MRFQTSTLLIIFALCSSNLIAQTDAINERAMLIVKKRKDPGLSINDAMDALANEPEPNLVWLVTGVFTNYPDTTPEQAAQLLSAAVSREDCFHQIAAQIALSKNALPSIDLLLAQKGNESKFAAATVMAIRSQLSFAKIKGKGAKGIGKPIDFTDQIRPLLENKNREIVELAILTAAYSGANLDNEVDAVSFKKSPETMAAQALYNAKRGRPLPDSMSELTGMRVKSDRKYQKMSAALSTFDPTAHPFCYAAQAIGIAKEKGELEFLHEALTNRDIRVQMDAAHALELIGDEYSVDPLIAALPKATWPARTKIYSALGAIPAKRSMPVLIQEMKDEPGRLRLDISYTMASIIGQDVGGDAEGWETTWKAMEADFEVNLKTTTDFRRDNSLTDMRVRALGSFYDLGIYSAKFIYVVDTSASMKGERIKNLEENLSTSTADLKEPAEFNIIMFGGELDFASDRMITATSGTYVADQISNLKLSVATRTFDAIYMAGQFDEIDSIYFLSDGAPVLGSFGKWYTIIPAYKFLNRYRPIAMYTVPYNAGAGNEKAMKAFSSENYGRCSGLNE